MQLLTYDRTNSAQAAGVALVTIAATALLAVVAAYWTWQWLAPRPASRAPAAPVEISAGASAAGLFGAAQRKAGSTVPAVSDIRLLGIVAASAGHNGYAVLRLEPRQIITVQEGKDITSGIRLAEVGVDHVILDRGGTRQTLSWPTKGTTAVSPIPHIGK